MARKSRKIDQSEIMLKRPVQYNTAIYARLSVENNGINNDSIENQIDIIQQYIKKFPEFKIVKVFIDNGETGTNFERPAFLDMMEAIKEGGINCVIVKDLSRFGRNYLEVGNYLEKVFPYLGVRFLSVNDRFDSLHKEKSDTLLLPLKSILHDVYAKDISKKIGTAIDIKKKSGRFMGKIPPYGYIRDKKDRYQLCVHPERSKIVQQIFQWYLEGVSPTKIAYYLNHMDVPTQLQIRFMDGYSDGRANALWRSTVITDILKNPCYLGCIVERKSSHLLYKGKYYEMIPSDKWNVIENTHEPIIDRETFEAVKKLLVENKTKKKGRF